MAKKFVRGITDINKINKQDFDTNNVNDLLSDGEHNYIHRKKKDKTEEYHNLTNNLKTIKSDNTDLLAVTNNNNTANTATLHPKHNKRKEQVLESARNTIEIIHGRNGTDDKTVIDVNASKVALLDNIHAGDNVTIDKSGNELTISSSGGIEPEYTDYEQGKLFVLKEDFGPRLTFTIFIFQYKPEYLLEGQLKDDLASVLGTLPPNTPELPYVISNAGITLSYDMHNVKIIMNTPSDMNAVQATFTFLNRF